MTTATQTKQANASAAHTPGPWVADGARIDQSESGAMIAKCGPAFGSGAADRIAANAAFIVAACNSHDANIARIAELEAALTRLAEYTRELGVAFKAAGGHESNDPAALRFASAALAKGQA